MGSSVQVTVQTTLTRMPNIKLTYFDLRARAEPCRLLLAYGGLQYKDERIPPPWEPASTWATVKPTTPFGQLPLLQWDDEIICQSMACARFVAREVGLAGNTSMESAQVDEIIDVIQDLINAGVKLFFAKDEAGQKKHAEVTVPTALGQLETKLASRGGQFFVGNNFKLPLQQSPPLLLLPQLLLLLQQLPPLLLLPQLLQLLLLLQLPQLLLPLQHLLLLQHLVLDT